jgi:hypothetical protein
VSKVPQPKDKHLATANGAFLKSVFSSKKATKEAWPPAHKLRNSTHHTPLFHTASQGLVRLLSRGLVTCAEIPTLWKSNLLPIGTVVKFDGYYLLVISRTRYLMRVLELASATAPLTNGGELSGLVFVGISNATCRRWLQILGRMHIPGNLVLGGDCWNF